jgi:hypothetical protein
VGDGRALIAGDIGYSRLQEGLGDGEDALAVEDLAIAQPQFLNFLLKERSAMTVPYFNTKARGALGPGLDVSINPPVAFVTKQ